jgi:hypothetical protein
MRNWLVTAAFLAGIGVSPAAQAEVPWHITKTEWTAADETGFGDFVRAIALSNCKTTIECIGGPANPYRASDPKTLNFAADCAKFAYMLRAYYAWKNGLPFSYVNAISGETADMRFDTRTNRPVSRRDVIDHGAGVTGAAILNDVRDHVSSATFRMDAAANGRLLSDFYSPKIQPGSIRAGTTIYDTNGHVMTVYDVTADGRILYLDADPDHSVSRGVYGAQTPQSPTWLGGGFKNFRPLKLVGAVRRSDGTYVGGHIVAAPNDTIADYSLEQYVGNGPDASPGNPDLLFKYDGTSLGYLEYVRAAMSGGKLTYNPVFELKSTMRSLCQDLQSRQQFIALAVKDGVDAKPQPAALPGNIYDSGEMLWEAYASPGRDARLRNTFAQFAHDISVMAFMWQQRDPRIVYDGSSLKEDLQKAYTAEAAACHVTYTNSAGAPVTLGFDEMVGRLFAIGFDPYHCIERRWGATSADELATCEDGDVKTRWYKSEQHLRNQAQPSYTTRRDFTLDDLEHNAIGSGTATPPQVDIKATIENIGGQTIFVAMQPVGF